MAGSPPPYPPDNLSFETYYALTSVYIVGPTWPPGHARHHGKERLEESLTPSCPKLSFLASAKSCVPPCDATGAESQACFLLCAVRFGEHPDWLIVLFSFCLFLFACFLLFAFFFFFFSAQALLPTIFLGFCSACLHSSRRIKRPLLHVVFFFTFVCVTAF